VPVASADQPYHLDCAGGRNELNDSLLVVAFSANKVPLVLAVRYQRAGNTGYAVEAIEPFLDVILDFFGQSPAP
jgi:hypothetical protein